MVLLPWFALLSAQAAGPGLDPALQPMTRFVGSCWRGPVESADRIATHCFRARRGGTEISDLYVVVPFGGGPSLSSGETVYRRDARTRRIRFDDRSSDGARRSGIAWATPSSVLFEDDHPVRQGGMVRRTRWTSLPGEESWHVIVELLRVDHPIILWQAVMSRSGPAPRD